MNIVLASSSPRRQELLGQTGLSFDVVRPDVTEVQRDGESPTAYVMRNAQEKAAAAATSQREDAVIIAADTVVVFNNLVLEKPRNEQHAQEMLTMLSGQQHEVITGVCLQLGRKKVVDAVITKVTFKALSQVEIQRYVKKGESLDKAGAYGAQGSGAYFISLIQGSYTNVVGLPMAEVCQHLSQFGIEL